MGQSIELTNRIIAAINELRNAVSRVEISIKGLSTYTKQITFGGNSVVNSAGVAGLLGGLDTAAGLISSAAGTAGLAGVLEMESKLSGLAAIIAGVSAGLNIEQDINGSLAATANILNAILKDITRMLAGISESEAGANAALRDVTDSIAGLSQAHTTAVGWMVEPI